MKKIELDPETGDVWMYLFDLPPVAMRPQTKKGTPAKARVPIGLGAGTLSAAIYTGLAAWLVRRYQLSRNGRHSGSG